MIMLKKGYKIFFNNRILRKNFCSFLFISVTIYVKFFLEYVYFTLKKYYINNIIKMSRQNLNTNDFR